MYGKVGEQRTSDSYLGGIGARIGENRPATRVWRLDSEKSEVYVKAQRSRERECGASEGESMIAKGNLQAGMRSPLSE